MEIKLFGIRHHGVGSCKRVEQALQAFAPDMILMEGVAEADGLISYLKNPAGFSLPIAQLIYNPKDFQQAVYYPFTEFSPEWKTMLYAVENGVGFCHFDLPQSIRLGLELQKNADNQPDAQPNETPTDPIARDPLGYLASLAGYEDGERWWELTFEQENNQIADPFAVFELIKTMMQELRQASPANDPNNQLREAYMRQELRRVIKEGYKKIAVVCGAWHVPALDLEQFKPKDDSALLKGLPKIKLAATWIPWTYERIANLSGYGAGLQSPAWYHFLYHNPQNAVYNWVVSVAHCLRKADIETSSAHLIETVRLANTLSTLRGLALPTLEELNESVISTMLNGDREKFKIIEKELIIGQRLGKVAPEVPTLPLQQDIDSQIKALKLAKYLTETANLKASSSNPKGGLDLREEHDRNQSQFLHRLSLLGIPWAKEEGATGRELSTKNEYWRLEWKPEYALLVIEASIWGATLEQAATAKSQQIAQKEQDLAALSRILQQCIKSNLPQAFAQVLQAVKTASALSLEVEKLMQTLPNLISIIRYGDVRNTDTSLVFNLIDQTIPRINAMLPPACLHINEEVALALQKEIINTQRALALQQHQPWISEWADCLQKIAAQESSHPRLQGLSWRILLDSQRIDHSQAATQMRLALSPAQAKTYAVSWLEGFLFGSGLLLIHNPNLWDILNDWVNALPKDDFIELLPLLRRAFSRFSKPEREKMLALSSPIQKPTPKLAGWDRSRVEKLAGSLQPFF